MIGQFLGIYHDEDGSGIILQLHQHMTDELLGHIWPPFPLWSYQIYRMWKM